MKKFMVIMMCLLSAANFINGQTAADSTLNVPAGQNSPSLYTGSISLNIPIYTIKDPDFELPVSLVYNANAFMPSQTDKPIGMNWRLNANSKIIKKLNSDYNSYGSSNFYDGTNYYTTDIFYFNINDCSGYFFISRDGEIKVVANEPFTIDISRGNAQEGSSVIKIVDKNGYTYIYGGDISALDKHSPLRPCGNSYGGTINWCAVFQRINAWNLTKIVAPNGREMTFSYLKQQIYAEKFAVFNNRCGNPFTTTEPTIYNETSLSKYNEYASYRFRDEYQIDMPCYHGMMRFPGSNPSYGGVGDDNNNNDNDYTGSSTPPKAFESDSWTNKYAELRRPDGWVSANNIGDDYSVFITTANSPNTTAILSKIQISDIGFEINFNYKTDTIIDYSYENYVSIQPFLNTIQLKIDEEIKTCTLTRIESSCYELNTSPWKTEYRKKYYFLSKINTFKGTEYKFNYNTECDLPTSGQLFVDDYGFSKKNPQFGIITSMTDELGGKTCFTFEKHKYAKMKIYGLTSDYRTDILLETNPKQDLYNNFRIKKIETKDEYDNLVEKKEYNYNRYETNLAMYESYASGASSNNAYVNPNVNAVDDTNIINYNPNASSGLLHCDFAVKYNDATYGVFGRAILKSSEPYAVTYSKVTETVSFTDKKYKNVYYFPTYEELPDIFEENNIDLCNIEFFREKFWFYGCNSMSHRRGLLKQKDEYEGLSLLKRRTLYKYQPLNIGENAENFILFGDALKMYYAPTNTTKIITTEFLNGNEISTETQFDYDFRNRLSEKRTVDIDGKTYFTKYRYADDIIQLRLYGTASQDGLTPVERDYSGFAGGLQQIQRQGWLGKPVEVVSGFYENDVKYYTGGMISLFKKPSGNTNMQADFHPIHAENPAYYLSSPLPYVPTHTAPFATLSREISLTLGEPVADYQFMQNNGGSIVFDSRYKTVADYEYNNKLRLTKIIPDNAPETTYTWDRRNLYPVFETTNGFTTAFTYKLMIGLTSKTDPRGVTTYFDYDFLGRLIETSIKNTSGQKEKLQNYEYHYKK